MKAVYADVAAERARQDALWGAAHDDTHTRSDWRIFIHDYCDRAGYHDFRATMVKIAALAIAAIESCDRRKDQQAS